MNNFYPPFNYAATLFLQKIILMSATLNPDKLCTYYYWPFYPMGPPMPQASYFEIQGQMDYHVSVFYLDEILEGQNICKYRGVLGFEVYQYSHIL